MIADLDNIYNPETHNAVILTIGDELLIGQTVDTNSAWMGQELNKIGINVSEKIAVADSAFGIISGLERAKSRGDIILITGGLGPTKDDITKKVLAEYFGLKMKFSKPTYRRIKSIAKKRGFPFTKAHKAQCYMPSGCELIENKMGTAPGMLFDFYDHLLVSMPGVPYEMKYIMEHSILPLIAKRFAGMTIYHKTLMTAGVGESTIARDIDDIVEKLPDHISVAYLPALGFVRIRLTGKGKKKKAIKADVKYFAKKIKKRLGNVVYGYDEESLAEAIGKVASAKNLSIGTSESCTGGNIASKIVKVEGASRYYHGSFVTYTNELKNRKLHVRKKTLKKFGAVSEQTVVEMAIGGLQHLGVDIMLAISGIAGPTGGSKEKPVGTTWIACGSKEKIVTAKIVAGKDRTKNIEYVSNYALNMLLNFLKAQ